MTKKGTKRKSEFKQMAFETAIRNPERYLGIISAVIKFEGVVLNDENLLEIVSSLYLSGEVSSPNIVINKNSTIESIKTDVIEVNLSRNGDGGFPKGFCSRFWTYMRTLSELGFVYARYNKQFYISEMGKKLLSGEVDEQEAFSIQAMKFNRKSPYRNVSNDYNFFKLTLEVLLDRDNKGKRLSYEQFIVLTFNQSGEAKETIDIIENNTFADYDQVYNFVSNHYGNTNKITTVTADYPDVVRRLFIISGFVTIRYQGKKFIEINKAKIDYIKDIVGVEFNLSEEEKTDDLKYFEKLNEKNNIFIDIALKYREEDKINADEYTKKIYNIIDDYKITESKIVSGIKNIGQKGEDVHEEFKEIPAPLKLEFYISIFVAIKYKDQFRIRPNYKVDHIGKPYSHAPGNNGDIDVYSEAVYWLIEVTLIRNKTQLLNNETTSVIRHLISTEEFSNRKSKYLSLIAPIIHDDTEGFLNYAMINENTEQNKVFVKPYDVQSFISTTLAENNFRDMEEYSKKVHDKFRLKLSI
ncbi:MAG: AlwI family type II restriction endonuclease [bacterium]|nr:AlwI family type II restriction endonuclease [bacterium]